MNKVSMLEKKAKVFNLAAKIAEKLRQKKKARKIWKKEAKMKNLLTERN